MAKMGRPTKYNKEIQEKADEYVESFASHGDVIPTVEGLCLILDIRTQTAYNWADDKPEFFDTLDRIKAKQKQGLVNGSLRGEYNSAIAKLLLSHNHGVKETTATEHTGKDGQPIETDNKWTVEFVNATPESKS